MTYAPEPLEVVPRAKLEALAALTPKADAKTEPRSNGSGQPFDVDGFLSRNGIGELRSGPWRDGRKWVLDVCPFNSDHARGEAFVVQLANGAVAAGCQHNSCTWGWRELREALEPRAPHADEQRARSNGPTSEAASEADLLGAGGPEPEEEAARAPRLRTLTAEEFERDVAPPALEEKGQ